MGAESARVAAMAQLPRGCRADERKEVSVDKLCKSAASWLTTPAQPA